MHFKRTTIGRGKEEEARKEALIRHLSCRRIIKEAMTGGREGLLILQERNFNIIKLGSLFLLSKNPLSSLKMLCSTTLMKDLGDQELLSSRQWSNKSQYVCSSSMGFWERSTEANSSRRISRRLCPEVHSSTDCSCIFPASEEFWANYNWFFINPA